MAKAQIQKPTAENHRGAGDASGGTESAKWKDEFLPTSRAPNHETGVSGATW